ncbi:relaxase/mobilization nuclease domain-containing protein [Arenibacter sp. F20364]|uniref:relaxase/mobilization nuclease domain-containing protein n=1 Tax=Arenibacter sp. F20364 TaxID=2926415 RepID=UPI001FF54F6C|nr:relaxase/mobilization nuclease domain-containing protein [Arenibacter sp. F20364]MCK0189666.1 relaxase/mobilization nuclease domain-containing protein [Arenibacter sp. F20364]
MIARILYRNNVQGVLNYVLGKADNTILGFQNTYSDTDTNTEFFGRVLYYLGNRHDSEKRYVHATINLPRGEQLDDKDFFELSKAYMEHMGYGEQPFIVVRHCDTKHEHVHIVSTTIKEDCLQINLNNDFRRNVATQKYLEKQFGLSPSPDMRQEKELPIYGMPQFKNEDISGVRFYMQDIINNTLQKYKVRSFKELSEFLRPHHIQLRTVNHNGRIGVSFGIEVKDGYRSRFINGYTVHPQLSGPKLQKVFELNQKSKLLPMVKKRLEKQLRTTFGLFRTIGPEHLPDILRSHQKLDCRLNYDGQGKAVDFSIYDKSGYVLNSKEMEKDIGIPENPGLFESEYTQMYAESGQLQLELQRCIKEAYRNTYQDSRSRALFSEHIDRMPLKSIVTEMAKSERFRFLRKYLHTDNRNLGDLIQAQFGIVKDKLYGTESVREERALQTKAGLIKQAIDKQLFEPPKQREVLFEFIRSLGTKYDNGNLTYVNSDRHKVKLDLADVTIPDQIEFYASPGFIGENEKVLDGLLNDRTEKEIKPSPTAIFLPLIFPNFYGAMASPYRKKFENLSLRTYYKYAERTQVSFEKSPNDYIQFFNAKGFYFEKRGEKICIGSIYSKYPVKVSIAPKTQAYLESSINLDNILEGQTKILEDIGANGRDNLKNLWSGYLMERGQYNKVAYLYVLEGVRPNLPIDILEHHMENGLKEALFAVSKQRIAAKRASLLRQGMYTLGSLLGGKSLKEDEVFNGFKDELTDYSKYKGRGLSM